MRIPKPQNGESYAGKRVDLRHLLTGVLRIYLHGQLLVSSKAEAPVHTRNSRPKPRTPEKPSQKKKLSFKQTLEKLKTLKNTG